MNVKLATWNMAYWSHRSFLKQSWQYFLNELDCDILLFQEAIPDMDLLDKSRLVWNPIGGTRPWGSGIYSKTHPIKEKIFKTCLPGAVTAAQVDLPEDKSIVAVSLYGQMEKILNASYSIPNLHRIFSDLTEFLVSTDTKHRMVIGGDFNASVQIDPMQVGNSHKVFFDRLKEFQLEDCYKKNYTDFQQTFRSNRSKIPWQDDYFFISKRLFPKLINCKVIDTETVKSYSDHNPVVIELDL